MKNDEQCANGLGQAKGVSTTMTATNQQGSQDKKCPDCGGLPGLYPENRCPACYVKKQHAPPDSQAGDELLFVCKDGWAHHFVDNSQQYGNQSCSKCQEWAAELIDSYAERLATKWAEYIIGEDEPMTEGTEYDAPKWVEQENNVTLGANQLRAVQRQRLATLTKETKS